MRKTFLYAILIVAVLMVGCTANPPAPWQEPTSGISAATLPPTQKPVEPTTAMNPRKRLRQRRKPVPADPLAENRLAVGLF